MRQTASVERLRRQEHRAIPETFRFEGIPGLSREMVERLRRGAAGDARPGLAHPRRDPCGGRGRLPPTSIDASSAPSAPTDRR